MPYGEKLIQEDNEYQNISNQCLNIQSRSSLGGSQKISNVSSSKTMQKSSTRSDTLNSSSQYYCTNQIVKPTSKILHEPMSKRRPGSQQRSTSSLSTNEACNSKKVLDENYGDNDQIEFRAEGEPTRESLSSLEFRSEPKYVEEPLPAVMTEDVLDKYIENLKIMHRIADIKS